MSSRSKSGCLTCRKRKKKCDGAKPECLTCQRLHLTCGGYQARLLFENDPIREGIRRRGPPRKQQAANGENSVSTASNTKNVSEEKNNPPPNTQQISFFPEMSEADAFLWDSYLNRFCKTYTTVTDSSSPFLSVIVPLATRYEIVRRAVFALAALQLDLSSRPMVYEAVVNHRSYAQASVAKHTSTKDHAADVDQIMSLGTTSVLLLIISKLSGEPYTIVRTHLKSIRRLSTQVSANMFPRHAGSFKTKLLVFWKKMLSYTGVLADLVGARTQSSNSLSETIENNNTDQQQSHISNQLIPSPRFESLVARINSSPEQVSSFDIDMWAGELDFMPSVTTPTTPTTTITLPFSDDDNTLIREIYRTTLRIQHFKRLRDSISSTDPFIRHTYTTLAYPPFIAQEHISHLARLQIQYMQSLSPESRYDTSLLLPLGVTGPELTKREDKEWVVEKLEALETKLGFPQLRRCREQLQIMWGNKRGDGNGNGMITGAWNGGGRCDTFLWG